VTDSSGTVVYAAAHDPYGGIQKTWEPITFDPSLKFSGKEHDGESELDYFGARYYDKAQYRFISVDPGLAASLAAHDPQYWNLYSYCGNQPITHIDSTGMYHKSFHYSVTYELAIQAHFSPTQADRVASACRDVDNLFTDSFTMPWLHFPEEAVLNAYRMEALNAESLEELGFCLHIIQDPYAHSGYVVISTPAGDYKVEVNGNTHAFLSLLSRGGYCDDPDDPLRDPEKLERMKKETLFYLVCFRARWIHHSNDVEFQTWYSQ
jgi:RHS repeat-associated protein